MVGSSTDVNAYQRGMLDFAAGIDRNPFGYADQLKSATAWGQGWEYAKTVKQIKEAERKFELGGAL